MNRIEQHLPSYGCGACGLNDCHEFAQSLEKGKSDLNDCPHLSKDMFKSERMLIEATLKHSKQDSQIISLLDHKECDFVLAPLDGDQSCKEFILPLNMPNLKQINSGDFVKWRPLGCPIVHHGKVFETKPLLGVYPLGQKCSDSFTDLGICMVLGFEGKVSEGRIPEVQGSVIFLPSHCMMGKAHNGVVVEAKGNKVRIEGIHLAIWRK